MHAPATWLLLLLIGIFEVFARLPFGAVEGEGISCLIIATLYKCTHCAIFLRKVAVSANLFRLGSPIFRVSFKMVKIDSLIDY